MGIESEQTSFGGYPVRRFTVLGLLADGDEPDHDALETPRGMADRIAEPPYALEQPAAIDVRVADPLFPSHTMGCCIGPLLAIVATSAWIAVQHQVIVGICIGVAVGAAIYIPSNWYERRKLRGRLEAIREQVSQAVPTAKGRESDATVERLWEDPSLVSKALAKLIDCGLARDTPAMLIANDLETGQTDYGGDCEPFHVAELLSYHEWPRLRQLAIRNCEFADAVIRDLVANPVLEQIEHLDLSLGCVGDEGAQLLVECRALANLRKLDLHHHYISETWQDKLRQLRIDVDLSDAMQPEYGDAGDEARYTAIGE